MAVHKPAYGKKKDFLLHLLPFQYRDKLGKMELRRIKATAVRYCNDTRDVRCRKWSLKERKTGLHKGVGMPTIS